ncbi:MAG: hypothetical protein H6492_01330 [Candidatus Paracaedibacteraceae bacterium]|nr:hypothetical protein [Candidatus Paracaedibacteraceae bacterium]
MTNLLNTAIKHALLGAILLLPLSNGRAIDISDLDDYNISSTPASQLHIPTSDTPTEKLPRPILPQSSHNVIPGFALNAQKKPGGVLPIAIDPETKKVVVLLGYETENVTGFTDFGGSSDATDVSRQHTAMREFMEETALAFWEDVAGTPLDRQATTSKQLEDLAKKPDPKVYSKAIPWLYSKSNSYLSCLLPVHYQTVDQLNSKMATVRKKVSSAPFHEKHSFVWVPLEDMIQQIESNTLYYPIPGHSGKRIAWRFIGKGVPGRENLADFKGGKLHYLYERCIKYLKEIIRLN